MGFFINGVTSYLGLPVATPPIRSPYHTKLVYFTWVTRVPPHPSVTRVAPSGTIVDAVSFAIAGIAFNSL
jgi:hypothetical protein